jgi:site-specific recombinase XerD
MQPPPQKLLDQVRDAIIKAFLTHLAVEGQLSASTQNQALSALLFLYREVLNRHNWH